MTSQMVGALPLLGGIFNHGWFWTWLYGVLYSWGMMNLLAIVLERRLLLPSQQYQSFYRGDLVGLPVIVAALQPMIATMPPGQGHWYQSAWWHVGWLVIGIVAGIGMKVLEYLRKDYSLQQVLSPLAIYHNGVVFPGFIYWIFGCGIPAMLYSRVGIRAVLSGGVEPRFLMLVLLAAAAYWASLVWTEATATEEKRRAVAQYAHVGISARESMWNFPAAVFVGGLVFGLAGPWRGPILLGGLFGFGMAQYLSVAGFDSTGKAVPRPWAHVPFRPRDWNPFASKLWPFFTDTAHPYWLAASAPP